MGITYDTGEETWDRLTLLLIAQPQEGWECLFEEVSRREVERLAPHPRTAENKRGPAATNRNRTPNSQEQEPNE